MSDFEPKEFFDDIDRAFYEGLDPFFHHVTLGTLGSGHLPDFKVESPGGEEDKNHDLIRKINASAAKGDEHIRIMGRVLRYFSSETLLLLLVSGKPFGPFARSASVLRAQILTDIYVSIAERKVPSRFSLSVSDQALQFDQWISQRVFGNRHWLAESESYDVLELIVEEAELLRDRGPINAFKHGKQVASGKGASIAMSASDGKNHLNEPLVGVNWIDWNETTRGGLSIAFNTQEIRPDEDRNRIFATAIVVDAIREIRLATMNGLPQIDLTTPSGIKTGLEVKRQSFKLNFPPSGKGF